MSIPDSLLEDEFLSLPEENYSNLLSEDFVHSDNTIFSEKLKTMSK